METLGKLLIVIYVITSILSPVLAAAFDKLRGADPMSAMISTGTYDIRKSSIYIMVSALPIFIVGLVLVASN